MDRWTDGRTERSNFIIFSDSGFLIPVLILNRSNNFSDDGSADPGDHEHRGSEGRSDRGERATKTDPDPGDRAGVPEEPGEKKHSSVLFG